MFDWRSLQIETHGRRGGEIKTLCAQCSAGRKKSHERCLSVNLDSGVYNCHHCGWGGKADEIGRYKATHWERPVKAYAKPEYKVADTSPTDTLLGWFERRGITADVVKRHKIERRTVWMPQTNKDEAAIAFPYFRDGQIVNVKYRDKDKNFRMEKGAELCLYGLDDIEDHETLIVVEGELDKLALEVAGFTNCVSVPNGADTNLDCLAGDAERLEHITKFILAVDADEKGQKLQANLISRLGRDKCWVVEWPFGVKDANEALLEHGAEKVREAIEAAKPIPIEGAFEINDVRERVLDLYENGTPNGMHPGWDALNEYYRPRAGNWTAVISIPGAGKTSWMAALMINLAARHSWKFCVFPAENLPAEEYISLLAEIYLGLPFNRGQNERMSREALSEALDWLQEHFIILSPEDGERDLNGILSIAKAYCLRRGINGLVIDPWNELESSQAAHQTETQFVGQSLIKIRQFSKTYNVHTWVVVHPTKMLKDKDGKYPVPTLYDANGSAHWRNKADCGIAIYRDYSDDEKPVEIHIQKMRWKWCGKLGMVELYFDKLTGRYSQEPLTWRAPRFEDDEAPKAKPLNPKKMTKQQMDEYYDVLGQYE